MNILLFLFILVLLIVVHELGHFVAAKFFGIRVDEFGIGFPPRLFGRKRGETLYSINAIPFGGFVKIFGEDGQAPEVAGVENSFAKKNRLIQASVLVAGVAMNVVAAWFILSAGFMIGLPEDASETHMAPLKHIQPTIIAVAADSPAYISGIQSGDRIGRIDAFQGDFVEGSAGAEMVRAFIAEHVDEELTLAFERGGETRTVSSHASGGVVGAPEGKSVLGIELVDVGLLQLPLHKALWAGAILTKDLTEATAIGLYDFVKSIFTGKADFSTVSGPVGIVGVVGQASQLGLVAVLTLAAVISVNLAIINLIPFPALDGGRLLIVGIEALRRKPIPLNLSLWLNAGGFAMLIVLMLVVTYHDIVKLFI